MIRYLSKIAGLLGRNQKNYQSAGAAPSPSEKTKLGPGLKSNLEFLRSRLGDSPDFIFREFLIGNYLAAAVVFLDGMVDEKTVNESILQPLMVDSRLVDTRQATAKADIELLCRTLLAVGQVKKSSQLSDLIHGCLSGKTILLIDGSNQAVIISAQGWETRVISEPMTEAVVRGPREGFTENLRTNITMLRRKIKSPALTLEFLVLGQETRTDMCVPISGS